MLELKSIQKSFNNLDVLKDLSLTINQGEIFGLVGLSGAGKSTALRIFNLLERPTSGSVIYNSVDITKKKSSELRIIRQKIGMIFQHFNLLTNKTVGENVALPLEIAGMKKEEINLRVKECLEQVQLLDKINSYPNELSGGQKQRVAIARSIANHPLVLLADEPTSALDPITKLEVLKCLEDINKNLGLTIIIATHEMNIIKKLCHKVAILNNGVLEEILPVVDQKIDPQTEFAKKLLEII